MVSVFLYPPRCLHTSRNEWRGVFTETPLRYRTKVKDSSLSTTTDPYVSFRSNLAGRMNWLVESRPFQFHEACGTCLSPYHVGANTDLEPDIDYGKVGTPIPDILAC